MEDWKQAGRRDRHDRHRLGSSRDRRPPSRSKQKQDGRDERAGVRDADPEDERRDVRAPHHRVEQSGDVKAAVDLVGPHQQRQRRHQKAEADRGPVRQPAGCAPLERRENILRDAAKCDSDRERLQRGKVGFSRRHQALPERCGADM